MPWTGLRSLATPAPARRAGARKPALLASVADLGEATQALAWADLLDLKDPARGALGAWPVSRISAAVRLVAGRRPVSATVGDLPPEAAALSKAALATATTGVDIVKLGFFPGGDHLELARELAPLASDGMRLVAVLMADRQPDLAIAPSLSAAGFVGVMLDTADKRSGGLLGHLELGDLRRFVASAHEHRLLAGLAGSLRIDDVGTLAPLGADFLGFRGALCRGGRAATLDTALLRDVRRALDAAATLDPEAPTCHEGHAANIVRC